MDYPLDPDLIPLGSEPLPAPRPGPINAMAERLMQAVEDPRNAWIGMGMGGAMARIPKAARAALRANEAAALARIAERSAPLQANVAAAQARIAARNAPFEANLAAAQARIAARNAPFEANLAAAQDRIAARAHQNTQ